MRKSLSFLLCLIMILTLALPVLAEETGETGIQTAGETGETPATTPAPPATDPAPTAAPEPPAAPEPTQCSHSWDAGTGTDATCTEAGVKTFHCGACGGTKTETTPAKGHSYGAWSATVDTHSRVCAACEKSESGAHVFTESVTQAPTCKEEGVWAEYCPTCDYIVYEVLPKLTTHTYDHACDPDCNVCGAVREIAHDYQQWWSKDYTGHWYTCVKCGDKGEFGKHYPGPAATEEKAQLCLTCGYTLTPMLNHEHKYAAEWSSDETGHWYACDGCEDQKDFKAHDYDDPCDPDCSICGFETGNAHVFDGSWHSDEDGHWFVCTVCSSVVEAKDHVAPEGVSATEAQYCTACGYLMAAAQDHVHDYADLWLKDDTSHWQECECGEKTEAETHSWDDGTENEEGDITYGCTVCDAEYTEEAPEEEKNEFPWWIVFAVLIIALVGAVIALIFMLKPKKKGKFSN